MSIPSHPYTIAYLSLLSLIMSATLPPCHIAVESIHATCSKNIAIMRPTSRMALLTCDHEITSFFPSSRSAQLMTPRPAPQLPMPLLHKRSLFTHPVLASTYVCMYVCMYIEPPPELQSHKWVFFFSSCPVDPAGHGLCSLIAGHAKSGGWYAGPHYYLA